MRKLLVLLLCVPLFIGAEEIILATDKASALQTCHDRADASPQSLHKEMLSFCECIVENTDFEKAKALSQLNQTEDLQKLYQKASQACTTDDLKTQDKDLTAQDK